MFFARFCALCVRHSVAELTTREVGKHRVVSQHPLKTVALCTYDDISPKDLEINQNSRTNHEMSAIAWMKSCVNGSWYLHTNSERYRI